MNIAGIPGYRNLDLSGEAEAAASRMEARARAMASDVLFKELVAPLLLQGPEQVLEVGCGTAALTRRMADYAPRIRYFATDLSQGMLAKAQELVTHEGHAQISLAAWDVQAQDACPFGGTRFDLIVSSVMVPYLQPERVAGVVADLGSRLNPGGVLAFIEQDLMTDSLYYPDDDLRRRILGRDARQLQKEWYLGLRPLMKRAGLRVAGRKSFLWTDEKYGPYTRGLLAGFADAALGEGRITPEERETWSDTLQALADSGDFYYGLVYHRLAAQK